MNPIIFMCVKTVILTLLPIDAHCLGYLELLEGSPGVVGREAGVDGHGRTYSCPNFTKSISVFYQDSI